MIEQYVMYVFVCEVFWSKKKHFATFFNEKKKKLNA